ARRRADREGLGRRRQARRQAVLRTGEGDDRRHPDEGRQVMKRLLPLMLVIACGPKPAPEPPAPTLPSDGTDHTAKLPPAPDAPKVVDAWQGHELIQPPA